MSTIHLLILALAVSLDSFGVGITYGLKKMKISLLSILIICLASATMIIISMQIGVWISYMLSPNVAKWFGSIILIMVGIWAIYQVLSQEDDNREKIKKHKLYDNKIILIEIKKLGLVIQILKMPMKADIDRSGNISAIEAILLGIALSLDAFGAGLGAALVGFEPFITSITIATMSGIFILLGIRIGFWFSELKWMQKFTILPGIILILIGLIKII